MKSRVFTSLIFLLLLFPFSPNAQFSISPLFTDHMVLQRNKPIRVWGSGIPGSIVQGTFDSEEQETRVKQDSSWMLLFLPRDAGGPHNMVISNGGASTRLNDIHVGDVWVCSGQSNMEWTIRNAGTPGKFIRSANDRLIRHFKVARTISKQPESELEGGPWQVASPETVGEFTAVGYHFARHLRSTEGVPIGLLNTSWGGSRIEPWMSAEVLEGLGEPLHAGDMLAEIREQANSRLKRLKSSYPYLSDTDAGYRGNEPVWAAEAIDMDDWVLIDPSNLWEANGFPGFDGIGWYRSHFHLTEEEARNGVILHLGKIDDSDITWVNGRKVGGMEMQYATYRIYAVPASVLHAGKNSITIRCEDTGGGGGMYGSPDSLYVQTKSHSKPLVQSWFFKPGAIRIEDANPSFNKVPTLLYNKMIHPILSFPIKGVIWYQGESNAQTKADAENYARLFKAMIGDWRTKWDVGTFPFLYVQLANFMPPDEMPSESNWAILRESQAKALALENTGQAVIIDIGEADDIHPKNKHDVGYRLGLAAQKLAYGKDIIHSGPVYADHTIERNMVFVSFDHIGTGLMSTSNNGQVKGFAIAGRDKVFKWADAVIVGNQVMVSHKRIKNPKYIRYAWGNNPQKADLYNQSGLPACPFRTD